MPSPSTEEVIVAPPVGAIPPLTRVRGMLITSSLKTFAERGLSERYFAALPTELHEEMRAIIASSWIPEPLASAHYRACDALKLSNQEIFAIGADVGQRIRETFLGPIFRVAREAGTTPWLYFERMPRLFARICIGGGCAIYKIGPKEARAEWYSLPGLSIPYFRTAFRAGQQSIVELFCSKAYLSETKALRGGDWAFKASWV